MLSPTDYEEMPHWMAELILLFLGVQSDYEKRMKEMGEVDDSDGS